MTPNKNSFLTFLGLMYLYLPKITKKTFFFHFFHLRAADLFQRCCRVSICVCCDKYKYVSTPYSVSIVVYNKNSPSATMKNENLKSICLYVCSSLSKMTKTKPKTTIISKNWYTLLCRHENQITKLKKKKYRNHQLLSFALDWYLKIAKYNEIFQWRNNRKILLHETVCSKMRYCRN